VKIDSISSISQQRQNMSQQRPESVLWGKSASERKKHE